MQSDGAISNVLPTSGSAFAIVPAERLSQSVDWTRPSAMPAQTPEKDELLVMVGFSEYERDVVFHVSSQENNGRFSTIPSVQWPGVDRKSVVVSSRGVEC